MYRLLFMLLLGLPACPATAAPQLRIITLQHRLAEELLPVLQPLAGSHGTISAFSNQLIVNAEPEALAGIEATAHALDTVRRTWHITVSHASGRNQSDSRISASGEAGRNARIRVPDGKGRATRGVTVGVEDNTRSWSESGSMDVSALDGEAAFIRVGQDVPYSRYWLELCRRHARMVGTVQWQDVSLGFAVRPRQIGERVNLEITPRLAEIRQGEVVDFTELTTQVQVSPGEWTDLGGILQSRDEVSRAILGYDQGGGNSGMQLRVKVE